MVLLQDLNDDNVQNGFALFEKLGPKFLALSGRTAGTQKKQLMRVF